MFKQLEKTRVWLWARYMPAQIRDFNMVVGLFFAAWASVLNRDLGNILPFTCIAGFGLTFLVRGTGKKRDDSMVEELTLSGLALALMFPIVSSMPALVTFVLVAAKFFALRSLMLRSQRFPAKASWPELPTLAAVSES